MTQGYSASIAEFCCLLGFVSKTEVNEAEFPEAKCDYSPELNAAEVWKEWSTDPNPYNPSSSKSSFLKQPVMKYLQRFLAYNYLGRKDSAEIITRQELFFLWCLQNKIKVNMGFWILNQFKSVAERKEKPLVLGSLITFLAVRLHLVDLNDSALSIACPMIPLDMVALERMCMICKQPDVTFGFVEPGRVQISTQRTLKRKKPAARLDAKCEMEHLKQQVQTIQQDVVKIQKYFLKLAEHHGIPLSSESDSELEKFFLPVCFPLPSILITILLLLILMVTLRAMLV